MCVCVCYYLLKIFSSKYNYIYFCTYYIKKEFIFFKTIKGFKKKRFYKSLEQE